MKHIYHLLSLIFLFFILSCNEDELEATIPSYLKIDQIGVKINDPSVEGSSSNKITDAWVFVNDQLIGSFELPTLIPILESGQTNIKVRAGVLNNGLSNQREVYPFYEFYILDTNLVPETVYAPPIVVEYRSGVVFNTDWPGENFETGVSLQNNPSSDVNLTRTTEPSKVFEGNASGALTLPTGTTFAEIFTSDIRDIPRIGTAVYLEMDYKTTHDIAVSIYTNNRDQQFSVVNFRPTDGWNKVYIDFSRVFSTLFNASNYNIAIGMVKPVDENAELLIDNLKLIHF